MKRNVLNAAMAAGLFAVSGGSANAVELSPDGFGQVLIYPYYTVNRGQQTIITVVNSTNVAKAVRVRFLEGYNAREVLDLNVFLSEYDVWTATVFALADAGIAGDGAAITTTDRSCIFPDKAEWTGTIISNRPYQEFLPFAYSGTHQDTGPTGIARTREGHVEMVQMADLGGQLRTGVTQVNGTPRNCSVVRTIDPANTELLPPTGGLFGAAGIVNVPQGTFYTYNADAISGFSKIALYEDHTAPAPSLAQANTGPGVATAYVLDAAGERFRSDYPTSGQPSQAIDAVSAVFMASALLNEYNVDAWVGSNTDWVVTFPTKRFYVDPEILGLPLGSAGALPPFNFTFGQPLTATPYAPGNGDGRSCSHIALLPFDRESGRPSGNAPGFPGIPPPISTLCTSVNVIGIVSGSLTESAVLGSQLYSRVPPFASSGWLRLAFETTTQRHALRASSDGDVYGGLPATGFQAVNYINENSAPGVLSNYSAAFRHRAVRTCVNAIAGSCP